MELKKEFGSIVQNCRVLSKHLDLDFDFQETVPAYLDDIYRVVQCCVRGFVTSADISFNEIKVFGKYEICLTYYNDRSNLCYADFEEEFSKTLTAEGLSDAAFVRCHMDDKYSNFRVINQRRIDVHASSVLRIDVYDRFSESCLCRCEGARLRTEKMKLSCVYTTNIAKMDFDEEFGIPSDSPAIERIVSASAYAVLGETKVIRDKAFIKGVVNTAVLYTADGDEEGLMRCEHAFPVSKIIDIPGIDENDMLITDFSVGSIFFKAKMSAGETLDAVNVYGEVIADSIVIRESEQALVTDGYMPNRKTSCAYHELPVVCAGKLLRENQQVKLSFEINADIREMKDLAVKMTDPVIKGDKLVTAANLNAVCLLDGGEVTALSLNRELSFDALGYEDAVAAIGLVSFDYSFSGTQRLDVRLNLLLTAYYYRHSPMKLLSDMEAGDEVSGAPSLTVYFGKNEESVWSIAKRFSSDAQRIIAENGLSGETLDSDRVLIIPKIGEAVYES